MIKNIIDMLKKTWMYLVIALIITFVLRWKFGAEFFDLFGLIIFSGLIFIGLFELYRKKPMPDWIAFSLVVVGLMGLLVDSVTSFQIIKSFFSIG